MRGGGCIFAVGKKDSDKQREVWHGSRVSQASADPPSPPDLASPSALLALECTADDPIFLSKKDGRC